MKEIYEWVPWFMELSQKIAEGGERYLVERAKTVDWKDDGTESALLKYGDSNIDPLSFFYTLASLRVRPETLCRITEFSEHESNGRELDEGERVAVEVLPVLGQSAAAVEPGDGAFDHRAQHAARALPTLQRLPGQGPVHAGCRPARPRIAVKKRVQSRPESRRRAFQHRRSPENRPCPPKRTRRPAGARRPRPTPPTAAPRGRFTPSHNRKSASLPLHEISALEASGCNRANVVHKPRLLSDNGSSYISGDLAEWLEDHGMDHVRGAPYHPQTQGKIERWHQTLKNRILLENYYLPGDLENQISAFVDHYNNQRYHESIGNVTPADAYFGRHTAIIEKRKRIKKLTTQNRRLNHQRQAA